jgi:hypothetical protein
MSQGAVAPIYEASRPTRKQTVDENPLAIEKAVLKT